MAIIIYKIIVLGYQAMIIAAKTFVKHFGFNYDAI